MAVRFIKDIVVRYGMPNSITTDNGTNFAKGALAQYCSISGIRLDLASVAHPQSNGQVERANGLILSGIKPRLVKPLIRSPGSWLDELSAVLWSLRTTPNRSTGFTPFFLVYGVKAVIPTDVEFDLPRVMMYTEAEAKEAREDGVDLLEEARIASARARSPRVRRGPGILLPGIRVTVDVRLLGAALRVVQKQAVVVAGTTPPSSARSGWNSSWKANPAM
nr:uncharacterized protein K02A2.6-like [Aegilops tauschii subsp. strangulata]